MHFTIPGELMSLNEYTYANRGGWGHALKKEETDRVAEEAIQLEPVEGRALFRFTWYRKNRRTDPDNICFAKKLIMDGLQEAGIIENDGWSQVYGFDDRFEVDKDNPRVEVEITAKGQQ
jgi:Holliday junction resolvase RusA-like endonuclease